MTSTYSKEDGLLAQIESPADLKALCAEQLPALAQEIRDFLIKTLSLTGGHLAPNLGVVELSLAMHRVFETPRDKFLFDVSHQSYIHKMMTGRTKKMSNIRQFGGISGFTKRAESAHDAFGAGHAGTSISAALGMAAARDLKNEDSDVVALVGDGAFGCGTTLEALNSIATTTKRFILVLNDNEWSIEKNVGSLARYLGSLQETETYSWLSSRSKSFIEMLAGKEARDQAGKLVNAARSLISPARFFQELGLKYYGPIDGHDIARLERVFRIAQHRCQPCIIHVITEKGRGYAPAATNPTKFHGVGSYNVEDGTTKSSAIPSYSEVFGRSLCRLAEDDSKIVAISAAMPSGTKLDLFRDKFPARFYDVGIAEEHAAIFACGLAAEGFKPYVAIYSTFMQRCIDMIEHDAALQNLPVRFCMDRAGLSPDDGPTHHGVFDISMMRAIPNLIMMQPKDEAELCNMLATMNEIDDAPSSIRYPRGEGEGVALPTKPEILPIGKAELLAQGEDIALIALGNMNSVAAEVSEILRKEGLSVTLINARFIKPLDADLISKYANASRLVVTLEDHSIVGGFGSAVLEMLNARCCATPQLLIGWPDSFVEHGSLVQLREKHRLSAPQITQDILQKLSRCSA